MPSINARFKAQAYLRTICKSILGKHDRLHEVFFSIYTDLWHKWLPQCTISTVVAYCSVRFEISDVSRGPACRLGVTPHIGASSAMCVCFNEGGRYKT